MNLGQRLQERKVLLVEWLLLAVVQPLQAMFGRRRLSAFEGYRGKRKVLLTLVPIHGNLGDHAIAHATRAFLREQFADFEVLEVNIRDIYRCARALRRALEAEDLVVLLGGGNTGDLYRNEEWTRRFVLRSFPDHAVVSLPQTVHFTRTARGRREMAQSAKVYQRHKRFLYLSRDPKTLDFIRREMPNLRTFLQPDMVLYLNEREPTRKREGITVCLRPDKESALSAPQREKILEHIGRRYGSFRTFDTIAPHGIGPANREEKLRAVWDHLRGARAGVTDRLHGMLFCAITGTPCVVIRSFDRKVIDGFRSIEGHQNFVFLVEDPTVENVLTAVERAMAVVDPRADDLRRLYFAGLREKILSQVTTQGVPAPVSNTGTARGA